MNKMNYDVLELKPSKGQKSFYGKAKIIEIGGQVCLMSYDTIVCAINHNNEFVKLWNGYSATTAKHINAFLKFFGKARTNKKDWLNMPIGNIEF